jgi:hypothetical protein
MSQSLSREQIAALVADVVAEHFQRLRADVMEKMLQLRTPHFSLTPMGELFVDGQRAGDVRPVFRAAVHEALRIATPKRDGTMPPDCPVEGCPCNDGSMQPADCTMPDCPNN